MPGNGELWAVTKAREREHAAPVAHHPQRPPFGEIRRSKLLGRRALQTMALSGHSARRSGCPLMTHRHRLLSERRCYLIGKPLSGIVKMGRLRGGHSALQQNCAEALSLRRADWWPTAFLPLED